MPNSASMVVNSIDLEDIVAFLPKSDGPLNPDDIPGLNTDLENQVLLLLVNNSSVEDVVKNISNNVYTKDSYTCFAEEIPKSSRFNSIPVS